MHVIASHLPSPEESSRHRITHAEFGEGWKCVKCYLACKHMLTLVSQSSLLMGSLKCVFMSRNNVCDAHNPALHNLCICSPLSISLLLLCNPLKTSVAQNSSSPLSVTQTPAKPFYWTAGSTMLIHTFKASDPTHTETDFPLPSLLFLWDCPGLCGTELTPELPSPAHYCLNWTNLIASLPVLNLWQKLPALRGHLGSTET